MPTDSKWDRVFKIASWVIVAALLFAAVNVIFDAPNGAGPVAQLLGILGAQIFYSVLYTSEAIILAYSKLFGKKKLRRDTLLVIYLTGFFTTLLSVLLGGPTIKFIDNFVVALAAAGCWLYWKFKTEYLTPGQFYESTLELREDLPPRP